MRITIDLEVLSACGDIDYYTSHLSDVRISKQGNMWYVSLNRNQEFASQYLSYAMQAAVENEEKKGENK